MERDKHSDSEIRGDNKASPKRESWAPRTGFRATAKNAMVDLKGVIMSDGEPWAVNVFAENAVGVAGVADHLLFVDPGSGIAFP